MGKFKFETKEKSSKPTYESRWKKTSSKQSKTPSFDIFAFEKYFERNQLAKIAGAGFMLLIAIIAIWINNKVECSFCAIIIAIAVVFNIYGNNSRIFIYNFISGILFMGWLIIIIYYLQDNVSDGFNIFITSIITFFSTSMFVYSMR